MLKLVIDEKEHTGIFIDKMTRFICDNIADIMQFNYELYCDADSYPVPFFPENYINTHSKTECLSVMKAVIDRLKSSVVYSTFSPLYEYVLYQNLNYWLEMTNEDPDIYNVKFPFPNELRIILEKEIEKEDNIEEFTSDSLLCEMEYVNNYLDLIFADTDFLEEDIRAIVEVAIKNPKAFLNLMDYEQLDDYLPIMPSDVAEEYQNFQNLKNNNSKTENLENSIVCCILNVLTKFELTVVDFQNKKEVEITRDFQRTIEDILQQNYEVLISREFTLGRAKKTIGETDLYFYRKFNGKTLDIAVLENKNLENFQKQYLQLMGYLNPNFKFGITVSINKKMTIKDAIAKIIKDLNSIAGEFKVKNIYQPDSGDHYLMSEHVVPETGNVMRVYHFILNLNDKSRQEAALQSRE